MKILSRIPVSTKYMVMSRVQKARYNNTQTSNKSSESVYQFKYLGITLTNQNPIHEEIKSTLKWGNTCYHSIQNLFSFCSLSKNVKITMSRTGTLPLVYMNVKVSRTRRRGGGRGRGLSVFDNTMLRGISGPERDHVRQE
jgi:hypothetical protein